jgi:antitoxin component YwqK of YwqJK toxin-antitoxin module
MTKKILAFLLLCLTYCVYSQTVDCKKIKNENGIDYIDDLKTPYTGDCVQYYPNGKKSFEAQYKNGRACGTCKWYFENGQISQQITYILDNKNMSLADGKYTKWFQDGKIEEVINYKTGMYDGEWFQLDKNGKIIKKGLYKNNKLISGDEHIEEEI